MNKNIKLLVENIFDELDDEYANVRSIFRPAENLFTCGTEQDLIEYISKNYSEFKNHINIPLLYKEIKSKPHIYPVTDKDMSRMQKCVSTNNWAGFDKITKPDKLVSRLAALLRIVVRRNNITFTVDRIYEETVLLYIYSSFYHYKTINNIKDPVIRDIFTRYTFKFTKLLEFDSISFKDVLASYDPNFEKEL